MKKKKKNNQKGALKLDEGIKNGENIKNVYLSSTMGLSFKIGFKDI